MTDPAQPEIDRAVRALCAAGVRILPGPIIGMWSDMDRPQLRQALGLLGIDHLRVKYLDGTDIAPRYRVRRVAGVPVPLSRLREMEANLR